MINEAFLCEGCGGSLTIGPNILAPRDAAQSMTDPDNRPSTMTKSWEFKKLQKNGTRTVEITVELRDEEGFLGAYAEDSYYYGDLTKDESIDLARSVLTKLDPPAFAVGTHVRVVDGALCGCYGVVIGTVREDGYVILRCRDGILLQPAKFLSEGF